MAGGWYDSSLTRVQPFFESAFALGNGWITDLLGAADHSRALLGDLVETPGEILPPFLGPHPKDKAARSCFEYEVPPGEAFLRWCVQHPDELTWPPNQTYSEHTTRMRRALLHDEAPGRESAQRAALDAIDTQPATTRAWWRFEGSSWIDCVIATDRLVLTIEGKRTEPLSVATHWYPRRSQLVRNLEAAAQIAHGRAWATLLLSEVPAIGGQRSELAATLDDAAPHLEEPCRAALQHAYLGNLTWQAACDAIGISYDDLPDTTDDF